MPFDEFSKNRKNTNFLQKKYRFHKNKVRLLGYVSLAQRIKIKDKEIEAVQNLPKPKPVKDIQVFLSFANFY